MQYCEDQTLNLMYSCCCNAIRLLYGLEYDDSDINTPELYSIDELESMIYSCCTYDCKEFSLEHVLTAVQLIMCRAENGCYFEVGTKKWHEYIYPFIVNTCMNKKVE